VTVFFIDQNQMVTPEDGLTIDKIKEYAYKNNSQIIENDDFSLTSQFRCLGGDKYIKFIESFLGYPSNHSTFKASKHQYDFKVFDSPKEMHEAIIKKNKTNTSRMLAGYCYNWVSKNDQSKFDISIGDYKAKWNLGGNTPFALNESEVDRVGCVHTIQGIDLYYAGVIIGKDIYYDINEKCIKFNNKACADTDTSHIKKISDPLLAQKLIMNTYRVLLTRGMRGTYVFCEDNALNEYLKTLIK